VSLGENNTTEANVQFLVPVTANFTKFWCRQTNANGNTTFTVRINGTNTSTQCILSGVVGPTSVTGVYNVTAGDLLSVSVFSNNSTARTVYWGLAP
jgi:hypothetical protein